MKQKFTKLIEADEDAFYMSCPEIVGKHIAEKLSKARFKSAIELCCAVGAFTSQLGKVMDKAIRVDINKERLEAAKYNAKLYGVSSNTEFLQGDVMDEKLLSSVEADVAILDPDWSAVGTEKNNHVNSMDDTQPSMRKIVELTKKHITNNIVSRIPKDWTFETIKAITPCEIETIIWNGKPKFKIAYCLRGMTENKETKIDFGEQ